MITRYLGIAAITVLLGGGAVGVGTVTAQPYYPDVGCQQEEDDKSFRRQKAQRQDEQEHVHPHAVLKF